MKFAFVALACGMVSFCHTARAAEKPPERPPQAFSNWQGFYFGTHIGIDASRTDWESASGYLDDPAYSPFAGNGVSGGARQGGQAGYNFQSGAFVFGVEADASFGQSSGIARCAAANFYCNTKIKNIATVAGRVGFVLGNFLWYGKAGGAWTEIDRNLSSGTLTPVFSGFESRTGVTFGAGAEYAFSSALSGKIEYDYVDFGRKSSTLADPLGDLTDVVVSEKLHLVKLGLNYHLGSSPRFSNGTPVAADALPQWSWTGFYGGVHVGGAFGRNEWISATGVLDSGLFPGSFPGQGNTEGLLAGGQIGVNYQLGGWVVGLELSASASDIDGYAKCSQDFFALTSYTCHNKISSIETIAGRLGQTWGNLLTYGKAGAARAHERSDVYSFNNADEHDESAARWGWLAGIGLEYAFSRNLSAFVEYDHMDFGTRDAHYVSQTGDPTLVTFNQRIDMVKMGVNYRLGWGAPMLDAHAGEPPLILKTPRLPAGWTIEVGARYFGSTGRMQKDLYSPFTPGQLNSRLIYANQTGHAAETFFRFDHASGIFVKGNFGLGNLVDGTLNDEDFPADINYSNTISPMKNGRMMYGSTDIGYNIIDTRAGKLGGFIGYHSIYNRGNGYGCSQIATDDICIPPVIPTSYLALSETESWRGFAAGVNAQMPLTDRLKLEIDAAYLPYVTREGVDNHWFRSDINPQAEPGQGWGTQFEAILSYAVSERFSVGVGGRYQFFTTTDSSTQFPSVAATSPLKNYAERYGGFVQTSYRFGDSGEPEAAAKRFTKAPPPASVVNWTGVYAGGTVGSGLGRSRYGDPFAPPVAGDFADLGGALAGGQIGANYQTGRLVFGAEIAASRANIEGTNTCFGNFPNASIAGFNCGSKIDAIGSLTGRGGYAFNRALIYAKGGLAWDRQQDQFNTTGVGGSIQINSSTNWGWTAGAGIEYALMSNWSVALEYKYYDFGKSNAFMTTVLPDLTNVNLAPNSTRAQTFTMGINYKLPALAITAKN